MKKLAILLLYAIGVITLISCEPQPQYRSSPFPEFPVTGRELWIIDEEEYKIIGTAIIIFPAKDPFVTVKVLVDYIPQENNKPIAEKIALYAKVNDYIEKAYDMNLTKNGKSVELSNDIGVTFFYEKKMGPISDKKGCNYYFEAKELTPKPHGGE